MTAPVVMIETPFRCARRSALCYLAWCILDSINRNEVPLATRAMYSLALSAEATSICVEGYTIFNGRATERELHGELLKRSDLIAMYTDIGISNGMRWVEWLERVYGSARVVHRQLAVDALARYHADEWPGQTELRALT